MQIDTEQLAIGGHYLVGPGLSADGRPTEPGSTGEVRVGGRVGTAEYPSVQRGLGLTKVPVP